MQSSDREREREKGIEGWAGEWLPEGIILYLNSMELMKNDLTNDMINYDLLYILYKL